MPSQRQPTSNTGLESAITYELLLAKIEVLLVDEGREPDEWRSWTRTSADQVRISQKDYEGRTPDSPERQINALARYHAKYCVRPIRAGFCFETMSAYRLTLKRHAFWDLFARLDSGALEVDEVVCYIVDRFVRNAAKTDDPRWRDYDLYELRHYGASFCLNELEIPETLIAEMLGHTGQTGVDLVLRLYGHPDKDRRAERILKAFEQHEERQRQAAGEPRLRAVE